MTPKRSTQNCARQCARPRALRGLLCAACVHCCLGACVWSRRDAHAVRPSAGAMADRDGTLEELQRLRSDRVRLGGPSADDTYGGATDRSAYVDSLDVGDAPLEEEHGEDGAVARRLASYTAPKAVLDEVPRGTVDDAEQVRHCLRSTRARAERRRRAGGLPLGLVGGSFLPRDRLRRHSRRRRSARRDA